MVWAVERVSKLVRGRTYNKHNNARCTGPPGRWTHTRTCIVRSIVSYRIFECACMINQSRRPFQLNNTEYNAMPASGVRTVSVRPARAACPLLCIILCSPGRLGGSESRTPACCSRRRAHRDSAKPRASWHLLIYNRLS
jgi:hypothetical protein